MMLDMNALRAAPVQTEPFPYCIVPRFVTPEALAGIEADYPALALPGSFPLPTQTNHVHIHSKDRGLRTHN